jgi:hypothetical protein
LLFDETVHPEENEQVTYLIARIADGQLVMERVQQPLSRQALATKGALSAQAE